MIRVRPADQRGHFDHGWLNTYHTFSFADYYDPEHMGFRSLRVINEDWVYPGHGFGMHPHRDMEIVTYVLEGGLSHKDSMGNGSTILPGDVQRMSAGTGISHSEYNASQTEPVHFMQIWIIPDETSLKPSYEQKAFPFDKDRGRLTLIGSKDGRDGSVTVHQDVAVWAARFDSEEQAAFHPKPGRRAWLQLARGTVLLNGLKLNAGDGAAINEENTLDLKAFDRAEILVFDLA